MTTEQRPGVLILEECVRGGSRQLSRHDGSTEVECRATHAPLDSSDTALGVSGGHKVQMKKGGGEHGRCHGVRRLVGRNASVTVNVHVQDRPVSLFKHRQIAQLLVSISGRLGGDSAPRKGVSSLHAAEAVRDND